MFQKPFADFSFRTRVVVGPSRLDAPRNGLVMPIHMATSYTRNESYAYASDYVYGRADNPTVRETEAHIAALERGHSALLFGSGMAAAAAMIMGLARPSHVIASSAMYYALKRWLADIARFGHSIEFVDTTDLTALAAAIERRPPRLVWIETPSNPLWTITDIAAVAALAHAAGAELAVDSTVATPVFTRPLELGADFVMHSATKYLNGHSDVSAGVLVAARPTELWASLSRMHDDLGTGLSAFDAWLLARGMRTLDIRVKAQALGAAELARRLKDHPEVAEVLYPGLADHPGHAIARRQMRGGFGGMLSVRLKGGRRLALAAASAVQLWRPATSLGGVESLIEHRASMEGASPTCPDDLLRLSVGIEDPDDLYADLDRAIRIAGLVETDMPRIVHRQR